MTPSLSTRMLGLEIGHLYNYVQWHWLTATTRMLCQYLLSISTRVLAKHCGSCSRVQMPSNVIVQVT